VATILIVDDQPANRDFLVALLGHQGHRLLQASDGAEALAKVKVEQPDLVIADLLMPTMDGFEFVERLRADPAITQTKIIFSTAAYNIREVRPRALSCGVSYILSLPAKPRLILNVVNTALSLPDLSSAPPLIETSDPQHPWLPAGPQAFSMTRVEVVSLRLAALIECCRELMLEHDPARLLAQVCQVARELITARYAAVDLLEVEGESPRYFFSSGLDQELATRIGPPPAGHGLLGKLVNENRPIRLRDLSLAPEAAGFPPHYPAMASFLGMPIASPSRLYGRLYLTDKLGMPEFSEEDEWLAANLADQVALIYENALGYAKLQRHVAELERQAKEYAAALSQAEARLAPFNPTESSHDER